MPDLYTFEKKRENDRKYRVWRQTRYLGKAVVPDCGSSWISSPIFIYLFIYLFVCLFACLFIFICIFFKGSDMHRMSHSIFLVGAGEYFKISFVNA